MNTLILCTALLLLGTKALDCLTTLRAVPVPEAESNPIARSMMNRLGVRRTTALVFVITTIWTCALTAVVLAAGSVLEQIRTRVVLCFGVRAGRQVRKRLGATVQIGELVEANKRRWHTRSFRGSGGVTIVLATHPRTADGIAEATDPPRLVRDALAAA